VRAVRCGKEGSEMRDERPNFRRTTNETRAQTRGKNDRKKRFATHRAWLRSRSECSLNRRMSGKLARWPPGFIVKSRGWFVICFARHDGPKQATIRGESSEHPQSIMKERLQALMGFWRTHLVLIFFGCGEVEEAVNFVIRHVFRFDICCPSPGQVNARQSQYRAPCKERSCCAPSSSSPRYLSKMGSSLMASTAARLVVRFRLKSLDWK
jgi:hypothetical protein